MDELSQKNQKFYLLFFSIFRIIDASIRYPASQMPGLSA